MADQSENAFVATAQKKAYLDVVFPGCQESVISHRRVATCEYAGSVVVTSGTGHLVADSMGRPDVLRGISTRPAESY